MCPLWFKEIINFLFLISQVVNSDPFEEQKKTNKACSADSENSTCGVTTYDGKPMPFSEVRNA